MKAIIAAASGYSVLSTDGADVDRDPIIAWVVFHNARRVPITVGERLTGPFAIERPDRTVDTGDFLYQDAETWAEAWLRAEAAKVAQAPGAGS